MEPLLEHRMELAGFTTRALELEGHGPPLLLLHGYADSADTWRRLLALLAGRGRRAVALDMPGFAKASPLDPARPVLEQLDAFAAAAVREIAAETGPVVIMGNSLGGVVALRAAQDPELPIRGVVPVGPAGFEQPGWFRVIEASPLVRAILASPVPLPEFAVRALVGEAYRQLAFARPRAAASEVIRAFTEHHRSPQAIAGYLAVGRRLLPELRECFDLASVRAPVLLLWGERDRMVTHRGSQRLLDALPDTEYELIRDVGHCPQVEAPERVAAALDRFVAGLAAPRAA